MSERGFIAVDRGIFDHPLFEEKREFSRREAWLWLISEAEWKDREKYVGSAKISVRRGQLAHSIRFIADAFGWHKSKVERFLERLKTEAMIETQTETGLTVITICNYGLYQSGEGSQRDSKQGAKRDSSETAARQTKQTNKQTSSPNGEEEDVGARDQIKLVVEAYSRMASRAGLAGVVAVNDKRKSSIKARIAEHGVDNVLVAISKIERSDFCCGRGPQGWKADFDFLLQPSSMIKLLEGKYDNRVVVEPEKPPDLADLFNRRAEEEREAEDYSDDTGRTIEGSYDSGDFYRPRQALPGPAAAQGEPGGTRRVVPDRVPQVLEACDRDGGGQVDPGRARQALEVIRSVAGGTGFRDP
ncbi:hypothetical protein IB276_11750 [Ensifer sp. ENS04]|uniref:hypothetical protein n=1 Tax=Ensifer sp. ENS04 TaxID=2769281 RepID=UPI00177F2366|nr:hypothetical protein [Ensifer sp. ENS04]MBD9540127.1 hypothetical protein [Ensifer sp. ENS04]